MNKSKTRIYFSKPISPNLIIYIKGKQHHFLKNVLRLKISDLVNIFDGKTGEWVTKIIAINRDNIVLQTIKHVIDFKNSLDLWLIFAPIKQNRMNLAIQKATEIGVSRIIPCITEFTNTRNINIKNLNDNALEAAEQCERQDIPKIGEITNIKSLLANWPSDRKLIFCDEKNKQNNGIVEVLISIKNNNDKFAVLIGPEGGFSEAERKLLIDNKNIVSVSLGRDRLLRSDTAITVSLFCIQQIIYK